MEIPIQNFQNLNLGKPREVAPLYKNSRRCYGIGNLRKFQPEVT